MQPEMLLQQLENSRTFFNRSSSCLTEKDSGFRPTEGTRTVAQQVAHVAQTIDWFSDGAFSPEGFDLDFSKFDSAIEDVTSLAAARKWLDGAFKNLADEVRSRSTEELAEALPEGPVMGGAPRFAVVGHVAEHTAHHQGALTVYSRLLGYTPKMPYEA